MRSAHYQQRICLLAALAISAACIVPANAAPVLPPDARVSGPFTPPTSLGPTSVPALVGDILAPVPLKQDAYLRNRRAVGLADDPRLQRSDTAAGLNGKVAIALMFVESDGSIDADTYTWTKPFEDQVIASLNNGLNWLTDRATLHGATVSFTLYAYRHDFGTYMRQGYEPVLRPSTDAPLWVQAVLHNLDYTNGDHLSRVAAYNDWLCIHDQADVAVTIFVCCNPEPAATQFTDGYGAKGYYGGPYVFGVGRTFETAPLDITLTHELLHAFYACDEYGYSSYGGCSRCDTCDIFQTAYPNPHGAANGNCEACNSTPAKCLMRAYSWDMCNFTAAQVGWPNPASPDDDDTPQAPIVAPIADATIPANTAYQQLPVLAQGTPLVSWSLVSAPADMTVNATTGQVDWPSPGPLGSNHAVTVRATNTVGYDDETWTLIVETQSQSVPPPATCGTGLLELSAVMLVLMCLPCRRRGG